MVRLNFQPSLNLALLSTRHTPSHPLSTRNSQQEALKHSEQSRGGSTCLGLLRRSLRGNKGWWEPGGALEKETGNAGLGGSSLEKGEYFTLPGPPWPQSRALGQDHWGRHVSSWKGPGELCLRDKRK